MKQLPIVIITLILHCCFSCSNQTMNKETFETDHLLGKWKLVEFEAPIPCSLMFLTIYDSLKYEFDSHSHAYIVIGDTLIIEYNDWGRQSFKIHKVTPDSLILQQIRQQIYADNFDEILIDNPLEKYIRIE